VTLIEMLVTLAVLLLMMTVIVQIFQAATGALNTAQIAQQLDNQLRHLDVTIRADLAGVTAKMTPPNDPKNNAGYLEYGENEFPDLQGEDGDDYIRFTAKAPAGRPFTGRIWTLPANAANLTPAQVQTLWSAGFQPITITSEYAEIIYFLRNGNLYRRVFLIAPERQSSMVPTVGNVATVPTNAGPLNLNFTPGVLNNGGPMMVSWLGVNDISAHPVPTGTAVINTNNSVVLNTLGHLTNRHNRAFYQRFASDFLNLAGAAPPDGIDDDFNGDNVPDYYPTLYPGVLPPAMGGSGPPVNAAGQLVYESTPVARAFFGTMSFPFVYPGAYSAPQTLMGGGTPAAPFGWIHSPNPLAYDPTANGSVAFDVNPTRYLSLLNHNPIDAGDNVQLPGTQSLNRGTWWGFPTWRETLSPSWVDPTVQVNIAQAQPNGLAARSSAFFSATQAVTDDANLLPPMIQPAGFTGDFTLFRQNPDGFADGLGSNSLFWGTNALNQAGLWAVSWEDDLIMTGVRSFDIKAYDVSRADYVDLGWGDDPRITAGTLQYLNTTPATTTWNANLFDTLAQSFAHEGRMPPLFHDHRLDASYPNPTYVVPVPSTNPPTFIAQYPAFPTYSSNIGDDNPGIVRLRRVWDSWSTDYSKAPATGVNPVGSPMVGFPAGPPYTPPIYPSYPPPYPAPLRGIQIQIRVVDPSNQRVKSLTIRVDFTDKL
jgi:type II secretory pathway pseudopilin PulG